MGIGRKKAFMAWIGVLTATCAFAYHGTVQANRSPNTLAYYDPALLKTIDAFGKPFDDHIPRSSGEIAAPGDFLEEFKVPDGGKVRVLVKVPASAHPNKILKVRRIKPGASVNDYFADAIKKAISGQYASVVFPKDYYKFSAPASESDSHLLIKVATDLTIEGQGSTLDFASPTSAGVTIDDCQRIVFRGFNVDWSSVLMASVGKIISIDDHGASPTMKVQIRPQYKVDANTQIIALTPWDDTTDPSNPHLSLTKFQKEEYTDNVGTEYLGNNIFQVPYYNNQIAVGDLMLVRHFGYSPYKNAVQTGGSYDVDFEHVNIYASPYLAFLLSGGGGYRLSHCSVNRKDTARLISSSADACHIADNVGDIIIEDSDFGYQGDDGLNIHGAVSGTALPGKNDVDWTGGGESSYAPYGWVKDNTIGFFDGNYNFLGVTKFESLSHSSSGLQINLEGDAPQGAAEIADFSRVSARYVLRNNRYFYNRARGMLLESSFGLVENNSFVGQTIYGILVGVDPGSEGPGVQDVVFRHNRFSNVGSFPKGHIPPVSSPTYGALVVAVQHDYVNDASPNPVQKNLIFDSNKFSDLQGPGMVVSSVNDVVLSNNQFVNTNKRNLQFTNVDSSLLNGSLITAQAHNVYIAQYQSSP
jgi:hypothetical protein